MWRLQRFGLSLLVMVVVNAVNVHGDCSPIPTKPEYCSFRIRCRETVQDVRLPQHCQGSPNFPVTVDLTLYNTSEKYDYNNEHDMEFLASVTTLRISGKLGKTSLPILMNTPRLRELYLVDGGITEILDIPLAPLFRLETVDLSYNLLTDIDEVFVFETESKLYKLSLAHNSIRELQDTDFEYFTQLVILDLSFNQLTDLSTEPFSNLTSLQILKLDNNYIHNLNGAINNLYNLRQLFLKGNRLKNIDEESLNIIKHLETFDVSENELNALHPRMFSRHWDHFEGAVKILLANNHLTYVPNTTEAIMAKSDNFFGKFKRFSRLRIGRDTHKIDNTIDTGMFTEIDLSQNNIRDIGYNAFLPIVKLISLDLSNNRLQHFNVNSNDLFHLQNLNLSCNRITYINHINFWHMLNLENLDMSHNNLNNIDENTFFGNRRLKVVNITNNQFVTLDNLPVITFDVQGGVLDLSYNSLEKLRAGARQGIRMLVLYLNFNNISDACNVDLRYPNQLTTLEMCGNSIEKLSSKSLKLPATISSLNLSMNHINNVEPSTFSHIGHLKKLSLAQNQLQQFEYGVFQGLIILETLDLSYNQLEFINSKVFMDLKSLKYLDLRNNGLTYLDDTIWLSHNHYLRVYIDGNYFTCSWLSSTLMNFNSGQSMMRPFVMNMADSGPSMEGIPCKRDEVENIERKEFADDRLLITGHKILMELKEQTKEIKKLLSTFQQPIKERILLN